MNKIKILLLAAVCVCGFTSCTIDEVSLGVSAVSYPVYRPPVRVHVVPTYRYYSYDPYHRDRPYVRRYHHHYYR